MAKWATTVWFHRDHIGSKHKLVYKNKLMCGLPWITMYSSLGRWVANDFCSWLRHSWNSPTNRDQKKSVVHGKLYVIITYISHRICARSSCILFVKVMKLIYTGFIWLNYPYSAGLCHYNWDGCGPSASERNLKIRINHPSKAEQNSSQCTLDILRYISLKDATLLARKDFTQITYDRFKLMVILVLF